MNFNTQQSHSCSSHTQSFVTHASPCEIHPVHVFSERVQSAQIITMITTRSRCCFSLSSNKQLRHTPQDSRSQTTQEMNTTRAYNTHDPNQPQSSTIFLMTSFNDTIIIVSIHISSTSFTFNHFTKQSLCCKIKITTILDIFKKTFHIYIFFRGV